MLAIVCEVPRTLQNVVTEFLDVCLQLHHHIDLFNWCAERVWDWQYKCFVLVARIRILDMQEIRVLENLV